MFRSNQYCSRYEETPIQLDTPIIIHGDRVNQNKSGYQFTVNDSSYFDWFNGFCEVKFSVNQLDSGDGYDETGADKKAAMINGSTLLINDLNIKQNGKIAYEGSNLFLTTHVKSLNEYSDDYARSIASSEHFYLDVNNAADKDNFGYLQRLEASRNDKEVSCIIPLNRYSFFKGLETNMLPPSQIQISAN